MISRVGFNVVFLAVFALAGGLGDACKSCKKSGDSSDAAITDASASSIAIDASTSSVAPIPTETAPPSATETARFTPPPGPFAAGELWSGSFSCRGSTEVKFQIESVTTEVDAIVAYQRGKMAARFTVRGTYDGRTHRAHFFGSKWLSQPPGDALVNFDGQVSPDGKSYKGKVEGTGCSTFTLHR